MTYDISAVLVDIMVYNSLGKLNFSSNIVGDGKFCGGLDINLVQNVQKNGTIVTQTFLY